MIKFFVKLNARATIFLKQDSTGKATSSSTRRFVIPRMTYSSIVIHCVSPVYTYCIEGSQATPLLLIKLPFFFTINARRKCNAFLTSIPRVERRSGGTHRGTGNLYADNSPPPSWGKFPLGERLVARNPHLSSTKCSA